MLVKNSSSLRNALLVSAFVAATTITLTDPARADDGYVDAQPNFERVTCTRMVNGAGNRSIPLPRSITAKRVNGGNMADVSYQGQTIRVINFQTYPGLEEMVRAVAFDDSYMYQFYSNRTGDSDASVHMVVTGRSGSPLLMDFFGYSCKFR
ncbi:hypothetical protein EXT69_02905 [Pantoea agglomerans]|uniref:hypothetical protein n=2 Tax=Gammaproteobacteria TaxID=1236 RepID=UPI00202D908F|nr:hypothetical protein [Pantoea agglomerans]MCL6409896.1 hypothetical protein [Pantoea agglomerans]